MIANYSHALGETISNTRLTHKIVRIVSKKFDAKICAIEEAKDTDQLSPNELISILKTYEINIS